MILFLNVLQYLILALWVGAMFGFGTFVAPLLFRNLPTREQAGVITGQVLTRLETMGLVTGGIMVVVTVLQAIDGGWKAIDLGRLLTAAVMLTLVILSTVTIRQRLEALRQQMGKPIDQLPEEDPLRREYGKTHALSRLVFTVNMLLGTLLIVLSAIR